LLGHSADYSNTARTTNTLVAKVPCRKKGATSINVVPFSLPRLGKVESWSDRYPEKSQPSLSPKVRGKNRSLQQALPQNCFD
jgi:hypothetical protein